MEIAWTFSIYLEAVAILPQLVLLQRTRNVDNLTGKQLFIWCIRISDRMTVLFVRLYNLLSVLIVYTGERWRRVSKHLWFAGIVVDMYTL